MLHFLKGKCYDKKRQFKQAALEYRLTLDIVSNSEDFDIEISGQVEFRLGWSLVRSKKEI